jgi:hypothetical protein
VEKLAKKMPVPWQRKKILQHQPKGKPAYRKNFRGTATSMGDGAITISKGLKLSDSHCTALTVTSYISANLTPGADLLHG